MKEDSLSNLAKKLNVSKSTLSKVARHCGGVDSGTREQVLDSISGVSLPSEKKDALIYTILPDIPQYFWKELLRGFTDGEDGRSAPVKYNLCTRCIDESAVLHYLDEAETMDIRVLVIAACITPRIRRRLETLTERCMVLLVSEYAEVKNAFYVGADHHGDGYAMGRIYADTYADRRLLYFRVENNENACRRLNGFLDAVGERAPALLARAVAVDVDNGFFRDLRMLSSRLAHRLAACDAPAERYCVYAPTGIPQLAVSLKKTAMDNRTVCLCHDCFRRSEVTLNAPGVYCNQDVYAQGITAAKAAAKFAATLTYPTEKRLLVPSVIG